MEFSEKIENISADMCKAQADMSNAVKNSNNPFHRSKYADLGSVRDVVVPAFNAHNIAVVQASQFIDGKVAVTTTLLHSSGEWIASTLEAHLHTAQGKSDKEEGTNPQLLGRMITYLRRYALASMACIAQADDDGDAFRVARAPVPQKQPQQKQTPPAADLPPDNAEIAQSDTMRTLFIEAMACSVVFADYQGDPTDFDEKSLHVLDWIESQVGVRPPGGKDQIGTVPFYNSHARKALLGIRALKSLS